VSDAAEVDLTVMIPAYLEAESLRTLLPRIHAAALALTPAYEILVIDTQQPMDATAAVCAEARVRHMHRTGGNQYGDAIRSGFAQARGRHILCMDADGSHNPIYFATMWGKRDVWDIVIGSRYAEGGQTENPRILILMSWVVNVTFRLTFNLKAKDVTNSFRLYRAEVVRPIPLQSDTFDCR
jgi:dolichol-phosphate mannosyltransferase